MCYTFSNSFWNWPTKMTANAENTHSLSINYKVIRHQQVGSFCILSFSTLKSRQNGRHFPDDTFKWIFLNENGWISIQISLKFVPRGPINTIPTLVRIMAWRRPGDKSLSGPMMVNLLTPALHLRMPWYVIRLQWFKYQISITLQI